MELSNIGYIHETLNREHVNELLSRNWILLSVYKTCYDPEYFKEHQTVHYVVACHRERDHTDDLEAINPRSSLDCYDFSPLEEPRGNKSNSDTEEINFL